MFSVLSFSFSMLVSVAANTFSVNLWFVPVSLGDGPCLGSRKPKQPYEWLSYREVSNPLHCKQHQSLDVCLCLIAENDH